MFIACKQFALRDYPHFFQESRLIFADSKDKDQDSEKTIVLPAPPKEPTFPEATGDLIEATRTDIPAAGSDVHPPVFGGSFDLKKEEERGHISPEAADFLRQHDMALEVVQAQYEYNVYTYLHTVQMLNVSCILMADHAEGILKKVNSKKTEADPRFYVADEDMQDVFLQAIVCHDWGKIKVPEDVLDDPNKLEGVRSRIMHSHPVRTMELFLARLIAKKEPTSGIAEQLEENRKLREGLEEAKRFSKLAQEIMQSVSEEERERLMKEVPFMTAIIFEDEPEKAAQLETETKHLSAQVAQSSFKAAKTHQEAIEAMLDAVSGRDKMNRMQALQSDIRTQVTAVFNGGTPEEKKQLQMIYAAASHHRHDDYPAAEVLESLLPDYSAWYASSGHEQATLIAMIDNFDACKGHRPYRDDPLPDEKMEKYPLKKFLFTREGSEDEDNNRLLHLLYKHWQLMPDSTPYHQERRRQLLAS